MMLRNPAKAAAQRIAAERFGRVAFEAYRRQTDARTYDGKPIPSWPDLPDAVRDGWTAAACAVILAKNKAPHEPTP